MSGSWPTIYSQIADELANQYFIGYTRQKCQARRRLAADRRPRHPARDRGANEGRIFRPVKGTLENPVRSRVSSSAPARAIRGSSARVARACLREADVVVYDRAVEAVLRWARPDAERIAAGAPAERDIAQDALSMLVADKAREGHIVAR